MLVFLAKNKLPWNKIKIMRNLEEVIYASKETYKMKKSHT